MPTRRFANLAPDKKATILSVAAQEFAAHGLDGASYNRIIERAGTSKGSMYYYFEDKEDLYATVLRETLTKWLVAMGPIEPVTDAEGFWEMVERQYRKGVLWYRNDPNFPALIIGLFRDAGAHGRGKALTELRDLGHDWLEAVVTLGQSVGAVRTDLPQALVLSVTISLSEGIDLWLAENYESLDDAELDRLVTEIVSLFRRIALGGPA